MKNLFSRLTRLMIIMLMLVDRTPFLNVYAKPGDVMDFSMSKFDVSANFEVANTWTLQKDASPTSLDLQIGQTGNVAYTITANKTTIYTFNISFVITMKNLTNTDRTFDLIAYVQSTSGANVYGFAKVADNLTIPAGPAVTAEYDVELNVDADNFRVPFKIVVGVDDTNFTNDNISGEKTAAVNSVGIPIGADDSITITDSMPGVGPWVASADATFTYVKSFSAALEPGTRIVENTVSAVLTTGTITSSKSITIDTLNQAPTANGQNVTTDEDVAKSITLVGSDPDGHALSYIIVSGPTNGVLSGTAQNLTYTPSSNYSGNDSFTFKVNDGFGLDSNVALVNITVNPINDAPVAVGDTIYVDEGDSETKAFNISDVDDTVLTVTFVTLPQYGLVVNNGDGTFTYTHNGLDPVNDDFFTFYVRDPSGLQSATVRVNVVVNPINEAPVANNDTASTNEDVTLDIPFATLLANDTDVDTAHALLTITAVGSAVNGTVSLEAGFVRFIPTLDFFGTASFEYTVSDGELTDTAIVTITVNPVNDAPVAVDDAYSTNEDTPLIVPAKGVLVNDTDVDSPVITAVLVSGPSHGSLTLNADGSFTYTPNANFNGSDSFTYKANDGSLDSNIATVRISVAAVNDAPVAVEDSYSTYEDVQLVVSVALGVLKNDTDVELDALTAILVNGPSHGSLTLNADGSFTYTPNANYNGPDSFTYKANDGLVDSNTVTVSITVNPINDAPIAVDDSYSTNEDVTLIVPAPGVLLNDSDVDGDTLLVSLVLGSEPAKGTLTLNANGSFTYVPALNDHGIYTFTYRVSDGLLSATATVTITVISQEDNPIATPKRFEVNEGQMYTGQLAGFDGDGDLLTFYVDTDPAHGVLALLSDGSFTYTHDGSENPNVDKFTFKVSDDGGVTFSAPADVDITILDVNDAPVANDNAYITDEDTPLVVVVPGLLGNDTDAENNPLTAILVSGPSNGSLALNANGSFTYTPNANFNGSDSFTYKANDGALDSNEATVTITINAVNDRPVAVPQTLSTAEDTPLAIILSGSDVETALDELVFAIVSGPAHGSISGTLPNITYTPAADYNGPDSFTFTVSDGSLISETVTVAITVTPVNDAPVAVEDSYSTNEDTLLDVPAPGIKGNDSDVDNDPLTIEVVTDVANGTLNVNNDGSFTYMPDLNFNGIDSFTYKLNDGTTDSNTVTVTINVNAINDRPTADAQSLTTPEDTPLNITLTGNDVETASLLFGVATQPTHGTLSGTAPNLVYTPNPNYFGPDSFIFGLSDGFYRAYATITINVTPVNDRPVAQDDEVTTLEDTPILINFVASDVDNASLIYGIAEQPLNGTLSGSGASRTYTPNANFNGTDTFVFGVSDGYFRAYGTITINVTPVNDAPVALSNLYETDEDTVLNVVAPGFLENDTDVEGTPLVPTLVDAPVFGDLVFNADGSFTYTPYANFNGLDSFTYTVSDGELDSNVATVTITVNPVEDAPVAVDDPDVEDEIEAFETPEDTPLVLSFEDLLRNDYDPDDDDEVFFEPQMFRVLLMPIRSFDFNSAFNPSLGSLSVDMGARTVTFTPPLNYNGPATFQYDIIDEDDNVSEPATVSILVTPVNDAPVASPLAFTVANAGSSTGQLIASDVDDTDLVFSLLTAPTNGTATVSAAGVYTYTHNGTGTLSDSFTFSVTDGELSATATVTVTVLAAPTPPPVPTNLPPVADPLSFTVANDGISSGTLSGSDPEGAPITFSIASLPANGSLSISPAGVYVYDHNGTATTTDSFTFTVSDGSLSATATVSITILPTPTPPPAGNTPPVVIDGVVSTPFGEAIEGNVAPLGSDADGDELSFEVLSGPTNGTLVLNPDGSFTYTPNEGFNGSDSFTFIANDGTDDSNTGTLTLNVLEEDVIVQEPTTPLAAPNNDWLWWLLALLAGLLLWLLAFLRPNMKYTLIDKANNQKIVRRRLAKPDDKTMIVELTDKDMVDLASIEVEFFKRLAKHCGDVTVKFMLNGTQVHSVVIPNGLDDAFTTVIHL